MPVESRNVLSLSAALAKGALVGVLLVLVSGFLPMFVQVYAWVEMTEEAGGVSRLGEVLTQAEPCEICLLAGELAESQRQEREKRGPEERVEIFKTLLAGVSSGEGLEGRQLWAEWREEVFPDWLWTGFLSRKGVPETPPPDDLTA
ncbi:MAG: hypothetical protein ACQKBY_06145 [Verrucomicrobiales bacterium]